TPPFLLTSFCLGAYLCAYRSALRHPTASKTRPLSVRNSLNVPPSGQVQAHRCLTSQRRRSPESVVPCLPHFLRALSRQDKPSSLLRQRGCNELYHPRSL